MGGGHFFEPLIAKATLNDLRDKENSLNKKELEFSHELKALQAAKKPQSSSAFLTK